MKLFLSDTGYKVFHRKMFLAPLFRINIWKQSTSMPIEKWESWPMVKPFHKNNIQQLKLMSVRCLINGEIFILRESIGYKHLYMSMSLKV